MDLQLMMTVAKEEGIEIGEEKGLKEGDLRRLRKSIKALQDNGMSFEIACRLLKLTEEEIDIHKDNLKEGTQTN